MYVSLHWSLHWNPELQVGGNVISLEELPASEEPQPVVAAVVVGVVVGDAVVEEQPVEEALLLGEGAGLGLVLDGVLDSVVAASEVIGGYICLPCLLVQGVDVMLPTQDALKLHKEHIHMEACSAKRFMAQTQRFKHIWHQHTFLSITMHVMSVIVQGAI